MIETLTTERLLMRPFVEEDLFSLARLHAEESFWWFPLRRAMTADESRIFLARVIASYESGSEPSLHAVCELSNRRACRMGRPLPFRGFCLRSFPRSRSFGDLARRFADAVTPQNSVLLHLSGILDT